ncbi:MAG TPA: YfhO family protein [Thermoanaerobaculia bacterium]
MTSDGTISPVTTIDSLRASVRRHRFAFAFLAAVTSILFLQPLLKQEVFTLRDHVDYFQPLRWFTAEELKAGRLPLWNPYSASGEPWLANPQTGVFYPPTWVFLLLPFATAYMFHLLGHLVILGWGAYLLFTRTGSRGAALVGAVAVTFSGPTLSLLDVSNNLTTLAWLPLALWCAAAGAWRRGGIVLALAFLGGEPFLAAVTAILYAVTLLGSRSASEPEPSRLSRRAMLLLLSAVVAAGLSAVQLLPFVETLQGSDRASGLGRAQILRESMPPGDWLRIVVPPTLSETGIDESLGQEYIPIVYMGAVVVLLALIGLTRVPRRRDLAGWLALLAVCVIVSMGPSLLAAVPASPLRYPARMVALAVFPVAALAAAGWDRLRRDKRWLDLLVVLILLADLVPRARPLLASAPFDANPVRYDLSIGKESKLLRLGNIDPARRAPWIAGYLNLYDRRFDAGTAAPVASKDYVDLHTMLVEAPTPELVSSVGIGFVITDRDLTDSLTPIARSRGVLVYAVRQATPMVTYQSATWRVGSPIEWQAGTSRITAALDAPERGVVTVRQQAARGWRVEVNGRPADLMLVDNHFLGVEVEKGRHEVVWTYMPWSLIVGAAISIIALLALQFSAFVKGSRRELAEENFSS